MSARASCRISRVRMKAGGADVRVFHRDSQGFVGSHMREWLTASLSRDRAPDAYAAVALWFDPETPGRPTYDATYCSTVDLIPSPLLVRMAASYLIAEQAIHSGEHRAIEKMGYEVDDWKPDDAS